MKPITQIMIKKMALFGLIGLLGILAACSSDDDVNPGSGNGGGTVDPPEDEFLTEGFVVSSLNQGDVTNYFVGYFDEMPTGDIDLVAGSTSFSFFRVRAIRDGFIYGTLNSTDDVGLAKYGVNKETKAITKVDEFAMPGQPSDIVFFADDRAVATNFTNKDLTVFNPQTMEIIETISITQSTDFPDNEFNYFAHLFYNPAIGKLFAVNYTNTEATAQFYDAEATYVDVIDANTLQYEKTIIHPDAEYAIFRGEPTEVIDESGNLYLIAQGQYGLDNNFGPQSPVGSRPQIIRINTSAEFDVTYAFNPIDALGFQNNFFQLLPLWYMVVITRHTA